MRPHCVNCSASTVKECLNQEELIIKLYEAEKDMENGTESYGLQMFLFGFSKMSKMGFSTQLYVNTELPVLYNSYSERSITIFYMVYTHPVGALDHHPSTSSFHND